ncbi:MAG: hypothetical protein PHW35_05465 [Lentimicrobiaceae bacterium]|jgi:hypothetical protein|nr:hypothetical protein [Lentimicrobiaceae bacterium]MDD4597395.1 hypothetical protein [Lentimicrobiaceae bacterium]MDY0025942.1 hypothetical protein [Lentimicrobium sp.]
MKNKSFKLMALMLGIMVSAISFTSCDKDDDEGNPPTIVSMTVADDNASAQVSMSEAVYKMNNKTGNLDKSSFTVTITGGTATLADYNVTHVAGTNEATILLTTSGIANGEEVLTVKPSGSSSIYNASGDAMAADQMKTANLNDIGIIGKWASGGTNVAPLLIAAGIDSVYAHFKGDNTYLVESFTPDGSKTTLTGTFSQQRSTVTGIWNITVNQSSPNALVSEGIFQVIDQNPLMMKYEIAQTDPAIVGVTPPTATGGFGSTSGGAFGVMNVQTYLKIN